MRGCLAAILAACLACSDRSVHTGDLPQSADFLPMVEDSAPDTLGPEVPRLILRCEEGRLGAYVVVGAGDDEPQAVEAPGVAVRLDSAPAC